ncbi:MULTISPECIES: hypothetical protein [Thermomonosporaceae]|uniref:hypothetical protein n=1 Tax=Thermomonosporaceae TaxID=2012 RepID=UPI00255B232B|nr:MULTISPECIES: hypothetical protein [Thermomonosporaceae]MDL4772655.1 hypothetical protein [Actinomadura xylanilytica]
MKRVPAVLLAALLVLSLSGCKVMKRISDGAYENAVADGSATLLGDRGVRLKARPMCRMPDTRSDALLRVHCTARTTAGVPVVVTGTATDADTEHPQEVYIVTVGGREALRTHCLGPGCRPS